MKERGEIPKLPEEFWMPMAIAINFRINDQDYLIPMVTEESSVVAAASNGAKMLRGEHGIEAKLVDENIVVIARVPVEEKSKHIVEASVFAELDPYRAATHNKGIMNGIDAVVFAIGGDIAETEAIAHSFAAKTGQYTALSVWRIEEDELVGRLTLPIFISGFSENPVAKISRQILGDPNLIELNKIAASVGLAQNYSALKALSTDGIQKGHMRMHQKQIDIAKKNQKE